MGKNQIQSNNFFWENLKRMIDNKSRPQFLKIAINGSFIRFNKGM